MRGGDVVINYTNIGFYGPVFLSLSLEVWLSTEIDVIASPLPG